MMTSYFNLLKYAATGIASPDMTYFDKMRASTLMGGATVQTLTGQPPLTFKADGTPLISWSMKGNGQQTGTPAPANPIQPDFVGKKVGDDWNIPISCSGQTVPVYLGEVPTVRRVKKLVLTGEEFWREYNGNFWSNAVDSDSMQGMLCICTHLVSQRNSGIYISNGSTRLKVYALSVSGVATTVEEWVQYLKEQYTAGTPVTVWYVLATEQTGIVNEPLCKIGDYADELSSTDAAVTIPIARGQNTLTVDTDLQPSEMTITFKG